MRAVRDEVAPMSARVQGQCPMGCGDTLWMSCEAHGYPAEVTSTMLVLVREGEQRRHERGDG